MSLKLIDIIIIFINILFVWCRYRFFIVFCLFIKYIGSIIVIFYYFRYNYMIGIVWMLFYYGIFFIIFIYYNRGIVLVFFVFMYFIMFGMLFGYKWCMWWSIYWIIGICLCKMYIFFSYIINIWCIDVGLIVIF